jgi:hypothetical protein
LPQKWSVAQTLLFGEIIRLIRKFNALPSHRASGDGHCVGRAIDRCVGLYDEIIAQGAREYVSKNHLEQLALSIRKVLWENRYNEGVDGQKAD